MLSPGRQFYYFNHRSRPRHNRLKQIEDKLKFKKCQDQAQFKWLLLKPLIMSSRAFPLKLLGPGVTINNNLCLKKGDHYY